MKSNSVPVQAMRKRWGARLWIIVADAVGLTVFLAMTRSQWLDEWLAVVTACGPVLAVLALWALRPARPDSQSSRGRERTSEIRIVVTPRQDEHGYTDARLDRID